MGLKFLKRKKLRRPTRRLNRMHVTIYSKDGCSHCMSAKLLLTNKGIGFKEQKLGEDFTREALLEMFPSAKSFPIIVVDGFNIGGFSQLKEMLESQTNDSKKFLIEG